MALQKHCLSVLRVPKGLLKVHGTLITVHAECASISAECKITETIPILSSKGASGTSKKLSLGKTCLCETGTEFEVDMEPRMLPDPRIRHLFLPVFPCYLFSFGIVAAKRWHWKPGFFFFPFGPPT